MRMLALPLLAVVAACSPEPAAELTVADAWVRLPAVPGRPGAAYMTLTGGPQPARLTAIASPQIATIELHETVGDHGAGGMMAMRPVPAIDVPARGRVALAPGGLHAMLFGLPPALRPGDRLPLTLRFADGKTLAVDAAAVAAGASAPAE